LIVLPLAYFLSPLFFIVALIYLLLNLAYSQWLKHIMLIDVLTIAVFFVLRVAAGVTLIHVARFSPWLYVVITMGALYLGFGKRRAELGLLSEEAGNVRKVLSGYTIPILDQYITIVSAMTITSYSLYTFSAPNLPENHIMMLTNPFVMYGVFRYLYLANLAYSAVLATGTNQANFIGRLAQCSVIIFASAISLRELGVASEIINLAFGIILGAIGVSAALAFGLGSQKIAGREVDNFISTLRAPKKDE